MILTVLGGSAHSTPVLVDALARAVGDTDILVRLAGRDHAHLHAVARACTLLAADTRIGVEEFGEGRWERALADSDVVLIQVRIGGFAGRAFDESFSLPLGVPGDEGLGPGGLSAAYRSWPQMQALFAQIRKAAPRARVILLSSPCSLLIRLAALTCPGWPLTGTCELPGTTLEHLCSLAGAQAEQVSFGYTGVNHLGFLHHVSAVGDDGAPVDLLARYAAQQHSSVFPLSRLVASLDAFPLKYMRLHFAPGEVITEQRRRPLSRAQELALLAEHSFAVFRDGDVAAIRRALSARRADWYDFAVVPLLLAHLRLPMRRPVFLTVADAKGEVREHAYAQRNGALEPVPQPAPAPAGVAQLVDAFVAYERVAAQAVLIGSVEALAGALAQHPWVLPEHARTLAEGIVGQPFAPVLVEEEELCRI